MTPWGTVPGEHRRGAAVGNPVEGQRYRAFISYNHKDAVPGGPRTADAQGRLRNVTAVTAMSLTAMLVMASLAGFAVGTMGLMPTLDRLAWDWMF